MGAGVSVNRCLVLTLRLPPSVNALYRNVAKVGRVKTAAYRQWVQAAHYSIIAQAFPPRLVEPPYSVSIRLPLRMRGDVSNRVKAIEDALVKAGVMTDDSRVYALNVRRDDEIAADTCKVTVQTEGPTWWTTRTSGRPGARSGGRSSSARLRGVRPPSVS